MSAIVIDTPQVVVRDLFASPVAVCDWPDTAKLNAALRDLIMARYRSSPSVVQSARYAWQSEQDMHKWAGPCVAEFIAMMKEGAARIVGHVVRADDEKYAQGWQVVSCWANVNPPGGRSNSHNHSETGGLIAGVYYVHIADGEHSHYAGRTIFEDHSGVLQPARADGDLLAREYALVPKPGRAAFFPAALRHYVEPNCTNGLRITIAFNLKHPDLDILYYPSMRDPGWWWRNFRGLMLVKAKIPEKLRAARLFAKYGLDELRRPDSKAPLGRRLTSARERAEVDASVQRGAARLPSPNEPLPDKNLII